MFGKLNGKYIQNSGLTVAVIGGNSLGDAMVGFSFVKNLKDLSAKVIYITNKEGVGLKVLRSQKL